MPEFIARKDCTIVGHPGIVRAGDRITLSARQAKYPRIKGWIGPAPAPMPEPPARSAEGQASRRTRKRAAKG